MTTINTLHKGADGLTLHLHTMTYAVSFELVDRFGQVQMLDEKHMQGLYRVLQGTREIPVTDVFLSEPEITATQLHLSHADCIALLAVLFRYYSKLPRRLYKVRPNANVLYVDFVGSNTIKIFYHTPVATETFSTEVITL